MVENFYIRTAVCSYLLILVNNYHSLGAQLLNLSYSSLFLSLFAAMGGLFSISMPCDQVVNQVSQCLCTHGSYIYSLSENLAALQKDIEVLKAKRDDVQRKVCREEFTGRRERLSQVQLWLTNVLNTENRFNDLFSTNNVEIQRLCLCGLCSSNVKMSYIYGKRVVRMLKEVESQFSRRIFCGD